MAICRPENFCTEPPDYRLSHIRSTIIQGTALAHLIQLPKIPGRKARRVAVGFILRCLNYQRKSLTSSQSLEYHFVFYFTAVIALKMLAGSLYSKKLQFGRKIGLARTGFVGVHSIIPLLTELLAVHWVPSIF